MDAGAIILAGGKSTRMGTNKALLKIQETPNVERIINVLRPDFPHPILVTNAPDHYHFLRVKTVKDYFPGKGPLAGIHAGLMASPYEANVVAACDMPFVSAELARALVEKSHHYDAVIPVIGGKQQPLFAVYKKALIDVIEEKIKNDQLRMKDLLNEANVLYVTEQELKVEDSFERIFFNMNHPHEYEEALQLAKRQTFEKGGISTMQFFKVKTVEETFQLIDELIPTTRSTEVRKLENALHYILAEPIQATESVPGFDRSTVDGYAVRASDTYGSSESMPGFLNMVGEVKMGEIASHPVGQGQAIYVPTGGMLPPKSDSVIMIEHCEDIDGLLNTYKQVAPGENVIRKGEDIKEGEVLLEAGTKLRPQELGAIASLGITEVTVFRRLKVGYLSSGDEIVPFGTTKIEVGQIRDINYLTIAGLANEWDIDVVYGGIVKDDYKIFQQRAQEIYNEVDCLILSGGSSVGAKDYTTDVIQSLGDPGVFVHGISIKPGKPTILALANDKPVIGLPGHPASAMIIFRLFGERILKKLSGQTLERKPDRVFAKITKNIPSAPGRSDYIRVKLSEKDEEWWAEPIIGKSGLITTLVKSDGIVEVHSEKEGILQGEYVPVILSR